MNSIADAIVYAVAYLYCQAEDEDLVEDDDDNPAIAQIMAYLSHATAEEEDALAAAAERALREEQSLHHPQQDMIECFENWMELMFGGNKSHRLDSTTTSVSATVNRNTSADPYDSGRIANQRTSRIPLWAARLTETIGKVPPSRVELLSPD